METTECGCCGKPPAECTCWEFPGWGKVDNLVDITPAVHDQTVENERLGVWRATAICGNDITSSCLYVSALAALYAGPLAPVALALVAAVLYLFRKIYAEVGSALPLNGGAYNVLLNTTTKARAALAACLTLLSYIATAVISSSGAMHYAAELLPQLDVFWATVILLGAFAVLNLLGISDSANVAVAIFAFHLLTLTALVGVALAATMFDPQTLLDNWRTPFDQWPTPRSGGLTAALFFGFSAAMLGISGFESSANYIEEQKPGVFPKTLRNMWIAVAIFNPLISLLSFGVLSMDEIANHKEALLSEMAHHSIVRIGGVTDSSTVATLAAQWISFDAVIVLSGAVLTSYVGVTGLMRRMSMDMCLPQFFLRANRWKGTNHWIIGSFFALCCSILLITRGQIETLAGVYTLSFLGVMSLFAVGNLLLKKKHPLLPRSSKAPVLAVVAALIAVVAALVGNVLLDPHYVRVFLMYFGGAVAVVGFVFFRTRLLVAWLFAARFLLSLPLLNRWKPRHYVESLLHAIQCRAILFIAAEGTEEEMRRAVEYVRRNEQIRQLKIVWCYERDTDVPTDLAAVREQVDHEFPDIHVDLLLVKGTLGPPLLSSLSQQLGVPNNYLFITSETAENIRDLSEWGGVRIVA
ncbi:putative amino acid permease YhdG [Bremerella volcania]|uniref:Putative amino acid permease YhdG n=1 Tax=Bremerella volcania TaxID=2527984 RepID=A0A518C5P1_9BACT|nr:APC family permease [Bremerella volcania]QDU74545.1 putative amino acid permease YhdG [Bremerella volcania]